MDVNKNSKLHSKRNQHNWCNPMKLHIIGLNNNKYYHINKMKLNDLPRNQVIP